jgi:hypothetical protein
MNSCGSIGARLAIDELFESHHHQAGWDHPTASSVDPWPAIPFWAEMNGLIEVEFIAPELFLLLAFVSDCPIHGAVACGSGVVKDVERN